LAIFAAIRRASLPCDADHRKSLLARQRGVWPIKSKSLAPSDKTAAAGGNRRSCQVCLRGRPMTTLREVAFAIGALTTATALVMIVGKLIF
jgi:hypothetical protein